MTGTLLDVKITEEQLQYLDTFTCERLSNDNTNDILTADFSCKRNPNLVTHLQNNAWQRDVEGSEATYLIKNQHGEIMFYFSLKTGGLFSHAYSAKSLHDSITQLLDEVLGAGCYNDIEDGIGKALQVADVAKNSLYIKYRQYLDLTADTDRCTHTVQVMQTFPSVELSFFCKNDRTKEQWDFELMQSPMGVVFFWKFVVDVIVQARSLIGFQYLFLFAADGSNDSSLIAYYQEAFKMQTFDVVQMDVKQPEYDFQCTPLCCTIDSLLKNRDAFFGHFNEDNQAEIDYAV